MKRELKETVPADVGDIVQMDCKAHPDEKGTESVFVPRPMKTLPIIARRIPMKRELKAPLMP